MSAIDQMRKALEFYADPDGDGYRVDVTDYGLSTEEGEIVRDRGKRARAALAAQPATSQPEETWMNDPLSLDAGLPVTLQEGEELAKALAHVAQWCESIGGLDMAEIVADGGITSGMVVSQEAIEQARRARLALATQPATSPMKMAVDRDWLAAKIAADPDAECDAGVIHPEAPQPATSQEGEALPPVAKGCKRSFVRCPTHGKIGWYDYVPYSLSSAVGVMPCGCDPKNAESSTEAAFLAATPPTPTLLEDLRHACRDALSGWKYIRQMHGDLPGVGWDRVQKNLEFALEKK